jgi:hypothetical protein
MKNLAGSSLIWKLLGLAILVACVLAPAQAQQATYNSGSTGADGAFAPTQSQEVQLPESGVFNFTTVNIPQSVSITFKRNSRNTPVMILASGNVTMAGTINVSGGNGSASNTIGGRAGGGQGGPGGFDGGRGGTSFNGFTNGLAGQGPGAGGGGGSINGPAAGGGGGGGFITPGGDGFQTNANGIIGKGGLKYGSTTLVMLIGGSGGGGGGGSTGGLGIGGGGGGGAILIASSGSITFGGPNFEGVIYARGASGNTNCNYALGGGGAGGAIRIVATTITGNMFLSTSGGGGQNGCPLVNGGNGSNGAVRVEAFYYNQFNPRVDGAASNVLSKTPNPVVPANVPQLRIASIAGLAAPSAPAGFYDTPDIVLPNAPNGPVTVALEAANIPVGSIVQVNMMPEVGAQTTVQSTGLTGSNAASTATASLPLPGGSSLITATVVIDLTAGTTGTKPLVMNGERVDRIEVAAVYGGHSQLTYVTRSGRRLKAQVN